MWVQLGCQNVGPNVKQTQSGFHNDICRIQCIWVPQSYSNIKSIYFWHVGPFNTFTHNTHILYHIWTPPNEYFNMILRLALKSALVGSQYAKPFVFVFLSRTELPYARSQSMKILPLGPAGSRPLRVPPLPCVGIRFVFVGLGCLRTHKSYLLTSSPELSWNSATLVRDGPYSSRTAVYRLFGTAIP